MPSTDDWNTKGREILDMITDQPDKAKRRAQYTFTKYLIMHNDSETNNFSEECFIW